jgi:large subunit ribosomal protein L6
MSRIGRSPVPVPSGVKVLLDGRSVTVTGPRGTLSHEVAGDITVREEGPVLVVERPDDERRSRSLHGLTRTLVVGVTDGFSKDLEIVGVGYRATPKGPGTIELALGFSHPVTVEAPEGVTFDVPAPTRITVRGSDKQVVGEVAARIRKLRPPEPYKGKGVRYSGEVVRRKAGKAAK